MITVVTPVSPIPQHPDFSFLRETLESVRTHLPTAEIILTFDGVRPEQEDRREAYEEAIARILWWADKELGGVCPFLFGEHKHQTGMMRAVIDEIRTPLLMYVEQDTPLVTDEPIYWDEVAALIEGGDANLVRFHHEAKIPEPHRHMMHGIFRVDGDRSCFIRTSQWSQRPHVASVAYYRRCLQSYFSPDAKSFIEDKMHGICDEAFKIDGLAGWRQHGLHIYMPPSAETVPGENLKRSYHLDGRAGEEKYDAEQVF